MPAGAAEVALGQTATLELLFVAEHAAEVTQIVAASAAIPPNENPDEAFKQVANSAQVPGPQLRRLVNAISNLQALQNRLNLSPEEVFEAVTPNIRRYASDRLEAWGAARPAVVAALRTLSATTPLLLTAKATQLAYTHQNVFVQARIVTQLRPVFDEAGEQIMQGMVVHEIVIDYYEGQNARRIEFGLDASDVADLKHVCDRAEKKAAALKAALHQNPWSTSIFGEPADR